MFQTESRVEKSWLPLEHLQDATAGGARSSAGAATSPSSAEAHGTPEGHELPEGHALPEGHELPDDHDSPHPAVVAAYSARTLQQRLEGAKAALRLGGAAAIDARLLLIECLPGLSASAKLLALITAVTAAPAAANKEVEQFQASSRQHEVAHEGKELWRIAGQLCGQCMRC